jgi:hypothetical protein
MDFVPFAPYGHHTSRPDAGNGPTGTVVARRWSRQHINARRPCWDAQNPAAIVAGSSKGEIRQKLVQEAPRVAWRKP